MKDKSAAGPMTLRARTMDFYVAFLVLFFGLSGLIDPSWPERFMGTPAYWIVLIEDIYLIVSALVIMASLVIRQIYCYKMKIVVPSIATEMFGWLFVSAAAFVIVLTSWYVPPSAIVVEENAVSFWSWVFVWLGLGISAFLRYLDLRLHYRSHAK